ncbi:MAG TPA: sensor histidine kinase [Thermoanaerobaculia bacterium]
MPALDRFRRYLRWSGLAIWFVVGASVVLYRLPQTPRPGSEPLLEVWLAAHALFAAAFWLATRPGRAERDPAGTLGLCAGELAAVLALVALPPCFGLEGALLIPIALQIGALLPRRAALSGIAGQTALFAAIVTVHWNWHWAVALAGAYLPFQVLAVFTADLLRREALDHLRLSAVNAELEATRDLLAEGSRAAERLRIAREMHDVLGHHLAALSLNLEAASHRTEGEAKHHVATAQQIARSLLGDVGESVRALREEETLDLAAAVRRLAEGIPRPRIHLSFADDLRVTDPRAAQALVRCAQEIITNAVRHARAENLWLEFATEESQVQIRARDDGDGASTIRPGSGLSGMRERLEEGGGSVSWSASPGGGFRLTAILPAGPR